MAARAGALLWVAVSCAAAGVLVRGSAGLPGALAVVALAAALACSVSATIAVAYLAGSRRGWLGSRLLCGLLSVACLTFGIRAAVRPAAALDVVFPVLSLGAGAAIWGVLLLRDPRYRVLPNRQFGMLLVGVILVAHAAAALLAAAVHSAQPGGQGTAVRLAATAIAAGLAGWAFLRDAGPSRETTGAWLGLRIAGAFAAALLPGREYAAAHIGAAVWIAFAAAITVWLARRREMLRQTGSPLP